MGARAKCTVDRTNQANGEAQPRAMSGLEGGPYTRRCLYEASEEAGEPGAGGGPHPPQQRAQQHEGVVEGEGSEGAAWCAEAGGLGGRGRGGGRAKSGCGACRSHSVKESRRLAA